VRRTNPSPSIFFLNDALASVVVFGPHPASNLAAPRADASRCLGRRAIAAPADLAGDGLAAGAEPLTLNRVQGFESLCAHQQHQTLSLSKGQLKTSCVRTMSESTWQVGDIGSTPPPCWTGRGVIGRAQGISRPKQSRRQWASPARCGCLLAQTNPASAAHRPSPHAGQAGESFAGARDA
jgi:hypothetical protein